MKPVERTVAIFDSFEGVERASLAYCRRLSPAERIQILLELIALARPEDHAAAERLDQTAI
jgi:hypothetical protein